MGMEEFMERMGFELSLKVISAGSASTDLTNHGSKIFGEKNSRKFQKAKLEFAVHLWHSIYIVLTTIYVAFTLY